MLSPNYQESASGKGSRGHPARPPPPTAPGSAIAQLGTHSSCPDFTGLLNTESVRNTSYKLGGLLQIQIAALAEKKSNLVTLGPLPMRQELLGSTGLLSPSGGSFLLTKVPPAAPSQPAQLCVPSPLAADPSVSVWPSASHLSASPPPGRGVPQRPGPAR